MSEKSKIPPSELKKLRDYLQKRGLKYTQERQNILENIFDINCHFQAEDLLVHMRKNGSYASKTSIASKATIYRTLPLLVKGDIIREVNVGGKQAHYECVYGKHFHDHLVCKNCREIIEFQEPKIKNLINKICQKHNFTNAKYNLEIEGYCENCQFAIPKDLDDNSTN